MPFKATDARIDHKQAGPPPGGLLLGGNDEPHRGFMAGSAR
jgi:hypothetical protein